MKTSKVGQVVESACKSLVLRLQQIANISVNITYVEADTSHNQSESPSITDKKQTQSHLENKHDCRVTRGTFIMCVSGQVALTLTLTLTLTLL